MKRLGYTTHPMLGSEKEVLYATAMDESNRELPLLRDSICARLGKCERKFRGTRNSELCGRQCFDRRGDARLEVDWNGGAETGPIVDDGKREGGSSADARRIFASW